MNSAAASLPPLNTEKWDGAIRILIDDISKRAAMEASSVKFHMPPNDNNKNFKCSNTCKSLSNRYEMRTSCSYAGGVLCSIFVNKIQFTQF